MRAAPSAGITLPDTGDFYGMEPNELLLHDAWRSAGLDAVTTSTRREARLTSPSATPSQAAAILTHVRSWNPHATITVLSSVGGSFAPW